MPTMYPAMVNSPVTALAAAIDATQTTITVTDATKLPAAPNLAVIGTDEAAETILYTGVTGNSLTGCTRGFQGTAAAWTAGTPVARNFTAYDHDTFRQEIENRITIPAGSAQGDILYRDATGWTRLPAGTAGQYLQTQGPGANPVWAAVSGGGNFTLISDVILAADSASFTFTSIPQTHKHLMVIYNGNYPNSDDFSVKFNDTGSYAHTVYRAYESNSITVWSSGGFAAGVLAESSIGWVSVSVLIPSYSRTSIEKVALSQYHGMATSSGYRRVGGSAIQSGVYSAITSLTFINRLGNPLKSGSRFTLYGLS